MGEALYIGANKTFIQHKKWPREYSYDFMEKKAQNFFISNSTNFNTHWQQNIIEQFTRKSTWTIAPMHLFVGNELFLVASKMIYNQIVCRNNERK